MFNQLKFIIMKKVIISLIITKAIALVGVICLIAMLSSCGSGCSANKWRKKRYVNQETKIDTTKQFVVVNNQIVMLK